ncbi:MAG: two-component system sensor histidine kinase NtrB [Anaeromyxobacteraceae bacterium]
MDAPQPGDPSHAPPEPGWGPRRRYALAIGAVGLAFAVRVAFAAYLGPPYITFYPAVMVASIVGGLGPGFLATALAALLAGAWILPWERAGASPSGREAVSFAVFVLVCAFLNVVADRYRRARLRIAELEVTRRAAQAQREAAAYARSLLEASLDPLVAISPEGKVTDVNRAAEEVTGVARADLVGTDFADAFTEPDRARAGYRQVLAEGEVRDYPLTIRHASGRTTDVLYNASIYRSDDGATRGVFAAARDVTERKRAEEGRQLLLARTARAERMAALGTMASGMSHEINNPLAYVLSGVTFVQERLRSLPDSCLAAWPREGEDGLAEVHATLEEIASGARRVRDLVADLNAFALGQRALESSCDLASALERASRVAHHAFGEGTRLSVDLPALPSISGSEAELVQLFACLLVNAAQAKAADRPNEIRIAAEQRGETIVTRVSDGGRGIPRDDLPRIFEPFFTTRDVGQGRGLGLAVALGIAEGLGGGIEVESVVGAGTIVTVTLPVAASGRTTKAAAPSVSGSAHGAPRGV